VRWLYAVVLLDIVERVFAYRAQVVVLGANLKIAGVDGKPIEVDPCGVHGLPRGRSRSGAVHLADIADPDGSADSRLPSCGLAQRFGRGIFHEADDIPPPVAQELVVLCLTVNRVVVVAGPLPGIEGDQFGVLIRNGGCSSRQAQL